MIPWIIVIIYYQNQFYQKLLRISERIMVVYFGREVILRLENKLHRKLIIWYVQKCCPLSFVIGIEVGIAEC